ncbi:stalk domain-containing protein [Halalkalibacter urbisdiaboli]|uniref:stalk domain-containing protein n=1 Tax=Halalkalibacter urbisdiaboli TaxID=1960589 RepID=UPI000B43C6AA
MFKQLVTLSILFVMLLTGAFSATAATPTVEINGGEITNGRTLVPLRTIFEELGATVKWEHTNKTVTATKGSTTVFLKIGSTTTKVNGSTVTIDVPAKITNGRTLVPLRFVSESLGATVTWDGQVATIATAEKIITVKPTNAKQPSPVEGLSDFEAKVVELTNAERKKHGLAELNADLPLSKVALEKSRDMKVNGYFSHTSPTYGSPFTMMKDFGIDYTAAGENIAMGHRSAEEVVQAWMDSEGHRANILNEAFTHIGVGESSYYWTQMFIRK